MASNTPRRRCSGLSSVCRRKRSAVDDCVPPAIAPLSATVTPFARRMSLPSELVADGPVKPISMKTGLFGTAASSSASVGRRPLSGSFGSA